MVRPRPAGGCALPAVLRSALPALYRRARRPLPCACGTHNGRKGACWAASTVLYCPSHPPHIVQLGFSQARMWHAQPRGLPCLQVCWDGTPQSGAPTHCTTWAPRRSPLPVSPCGPSTLSATPSSMRLPAAPCWKRSRRARPSTRCMMVPCTCTRCAAQPTSQTGKQPHRQARQVASQDCRGQRAAGAAGGRNCMGPLPWAKT